MEKRMQRTANRLRNAHAPHRAAKLLRALSMRVHRDQRGSMSIVSLFAVLLLTFLLGMVMNSGRQVDQKVKMQNAADSATYAGGVVIARGMNTLAFTNHLLCDVFALTAFMREARDGNALQLTTEVIDNWERLAPAFEEAEYPPFAELAPAISEKVPHEREMITTYSEWVAAASEDILPVMEEILATEAIPQFQRALVETTPDLAQYAADEIARKHGESWPREVRLRAVLWRTNADPVGGMSEGERRTVPVVDPVMDFAPEQERYFDTAKSQRKSYSRTYLNMWNNDLLVAFDQVGKMSQFANLWRIFSCGQLERLLDEYPDSNLPFVIRHQIGEIDDKNLHAERDFMFVGVVYREQVADSIPGIFKNPIQTDTQAYAQTMVYVPRRRLIRVRAQGGSSNAPTQGEYQGGVPGEGVYLPLPDDGTSEEEDPTTPNDGQEEEWYVTRQSGSLYRTSWDLLSQNWSTQLVPATAPAIPLILSTEPYVNGVTGVTTPELGSLSEQEFLWISNH
jgi:hypothetical protein